MKYMITHRHALFAGLLGLFISLILHDWNLYPNLRPYGVPVLSTLRIFLLVVPVILGWLLTQEGKNKTQKLILWILWLFFLPYTIYSVTEIRHVAEVCRLSQGAYTTICIDRLWTLYPTFIYALAGTLFFSFTLSQVAAKVFPISSRKRIFILGTCFYVSLASVFGLYTRFNAWDLFTKSTIVFEAITKLLLNEHFYFNVLAYFIFTVILFFALNRYSYRAHRYIFNESPSP